MEKPSWGKKNLTKLAILVFWNPSHYDKYSEKGLPSWRIIILVAISRIDSTVSWQMLRVSFSDWSGYIQSSHSRLETNNSQIIWLISQLTWFSKHSLWIKKDTWLEIGWRNFDQWKHRSESWGMYEPPQNR